jgi:hypothetical protein
MALQKKIAKKMTNEREKSLQLFHSFATQRPSKAAFFLNFFY